MRSQFVWGVLPCAFLYDVYGSWSPRNNPSVQQLGRDAFCSLLLASPRGSSLVMQRRTVHES